ncbi:MAG TPA: YceD family protein [Ilumatobacteraceae bacterium]|nr:YceD family protein [Ilumatobacteraceae bacterium]
MADPLRPLRINAVELLRQPGAVRDVTVDIAAAPLDAEHERLVGDIHVELRLTARNDGIDVDGTVSVDWATVCRRCLVGVSGTALGVVDELYQIEPLDPDAYLIEDGQLDLAPLVRETALLELETERVCREDCAGLCPVCGVDRNSAECSCDSSVRDNRWAALEGFDPDG